MSQKTKTYSADFKTKVVLELLEGNKTINEIASKYEVPLKSLQEWEKQFLENSTLAFDKVNEKLNKKNQKKRKVIYIMGGVAIVGAVAICILSGCISVNSVKNEPISKLVVIKQPYTKKFVSVWNKKIYKLKYDYLYLKIDFKKYEVNGNNAQKKIESFLRVPKKEDRKLKQEIAQKGLEDILLPVEKWITERDEISYKKINKPLSSSELMKYVSNSVAKGKPFSNSVIDKVVQLNDFCFYFERNKKFFYEEGYTKNIESCSDIEKFMRKFGLEIENTK